MQPKPLPRRRTNLPVEAFATEITAAIATGSLVLTAEPGAGKTSVVPLLAAEATAGRVVVLQPRRLAARAAAQRLAGLLAVDPAANDAGKAGGVVGGLVGLTMRGERRVSDQTRIEVMTEAVLTNRLQRDPELSGVSVIIFDEFHERNLHSDLALAMALEVRATIRDDLALVVMSATLDPVPIAKLLGPSEPDEEPAPTPGSRPPSGVAVIEVPGRTYPVETIHSPRPSPRQWTEAVATTTVRALSEVDGDVLVFVPGRREIDDVSSRLRSAPAEVVGLHGTSDGDIRRRVLADSGPRRVIVATAVAETSVTLPRIEAVVDGGLARRARFDPTTGLGRLETGYVTVFSADQRRGRAGRLSPGRCYRLWSREEQSHLDDAATPEILAGDPLPLAFELARWGDPAARHLRLLDRPDEHRLTAGARLLNDLGLVGDDGSLTERGRIAGGLGLDPRLSALLLTANEQGSAPLGALVAALLDDDRRPSSVDLAAELDQRRGALRRPAQRLEKRLDRQRARSGRRSKGGDLGPLLAAAWPDRIAQERPSRPGRYLIAAGREATLPQRSSLEGSEFIVVVEADGEARSANIRRAVPIERAALLTAAADHIAWHHHVEWDTRTAAVTAEEQQRLGAIVLHRRPLPKPPPELVARAIAAGLRHEGLKLLPWSNKANDLRRRLAWLHEQAPEQWPTVDDETLLARIDEWLDLSRCRRGADLARLDVSAGLLGLLDWQQRATLDGLAPTQVELPHGRSRKLAYESGRPVLSVRLQDLLGLDVHPVIGPNRAPVTVELLSPAGRPAQVTTDLPGFWRGSYAQVRADLRGRYPKHRWPERPWEQARG